MRLQDLLAYPREDLDKELKSWLDLSQEVDKANIAQAILALANHGGGYILIGFVKEEGNWVPAEPRPSNLNSFTQDIINGIVQRYAEPSFHCRVYHQPHPESSQLFPIIIVPGNHKVPIRAKRDGPDQRHVRHNAYYIRRPGPKSEEPQSGREWDDLISRCIRTARGDLLESIRDLLFGSVKLSRTLSPQEEARKSLEEWIKESRVRWQSLVSRELSDEKPSRYSKGIWIVAYSIVGDFQPPTRSNFLDILKKVEGRETGWPAWWVPTRGEIAAYPYNGLIECWLAPRSRFEDAAHSDFWRASPKGMMFLLRGYQEDSNSDRIEPGTIFDLTLPVWRVGECLLHAERLANILTDQSTSIIFRVTWEGLSGRTLKAWASGRILFPEWQSRQDSVTSEIVVPADHIGTNLPEIVSTLTQPLYEVFDFFTPPPKMIQEEISKMRGI